MTKTAIQFHNELTAAVAQPSQEVRRHLAIKVKQVGHQGDVYLHRIKAVPAAWTVAVTETRQVAVGDGIGSHHIADGDGIAVFWPKSRADAVKDCPIKGFVEKLGAGAEFCLGPVIVAEKPWTLTHPKHAHHEFPAGIYLATYQLDRATMRQVRD